MLVLCNFGRDQQISIKQATDFGLKKTTKIVAPVLLYTSRIAAGPAAFEGVIGGTSYYWGIEANTPSAKVFNDKYRKANGSKVPSDYGALGYAGVRSILDACTRAGSVDTAKVVAALEGVKYDSYKGAEEIRSCDHQSVQSVFIIESKSKDMANEYDVFNVLATDAANADNLRSCKEEGHA
jgi:branched-chain amino acid transport system substrate-binding protein